MARVNVVPSEGKGWIIGRVCAELVNTNGWRVGPLDDAAECNLFVDYLAARRHSKALDERKWLSAAFFTHVESGIFFQIARRMDVRLCMASKYAEAIDGEYVPLGIDSTFTPRLKVGVVGRSYSSGRKGETLVHHVDALPFVDVVRPVKRRLQRQGQLMESLRDFYASCDALLVPSLVEGGPMPAAEATACGTVVIAPSDVGNMDALPVVPYRVGDTTDLTRALEGMYAEKLARAAYVEDWTWENWALAVGAKIEEALESRARAS